MFDMRNQEGRKQQRRLTQAEVECWLYTGVESGIAEKVNNLLKGLAGASMAGSFGHVGAFIPTPAEPAKAPEPRKNPRPVRVKDLEVGCVVRLHKHDWPMWIRAGQLTEGKEYTVTEVCPKRYAPMFSINADDGRNATFETGANWEFVSNPNYVHGFRIGETVYSTRSDDYTGGKAMTVTQYQHPADLANKRTNAYCKVVCVDLDGVRYGWSPKELTRSKPQPVKPPVATYKVRDGEVQEGGDMWWLGTLGPQAVTMTPGGMDYINCKGHPQFYQLAEPEFDMVRIPGSYEPVKVYRYMQAPYNGDSKAYYAAAEQAIPEPKDWKVGDILRVTSCAGSVHAVMGTEGPITGISYKDPYRHNYTCFTVGGASMYASRYEWVRRP